MARNSTPALALGGIVVVVLALGAGLGGATLAGPGAAAPPPRAVADSVVNGRLDEFERRLDNLDDRLRGVEATVERNSQRLGEVDLLRRQISELRGAAPIEAPSDTGAVDSALPDAPAVERVPTDAELVQRTRDAAREIVTQNAPKMVRYRLDLIAKTGAEADAARRTQTAIEARQLANQYALPMGKMDEIQAILDSEMTASVRDVAPYLTGGLDAADYGQVKAKLGTLWDARVAAMADVLGEDDFKAYADTQKNWRGVFDKVYDDLEQARLDGR